jgi:hypothetical protein
VTGIVIAETSRGRYLPIGDVESIEGARRLAEAFEASGEEGVFLKAPTYVIWWRGEDGRYRRGNVLVRCSVGEPGEEQL